jgi:nitrite reductase/ring-hydroxylating ferredoxin subunit
MDEANNYVALCAVEDVTPDVPFKAQLGAVDVAVFQIGDLYYVTQDECTHGPGSLCEGYVDGDEVECPFHQGKFNIITGAPTAAPCSVPLKTWAARVQDGKIMVLDAPLVSGA